MIGLMRKIEAEAQSMKAQRVVGVSIWLGALSHMTASHFAEHFEHASAGTIAEGARLDVTVSEDINVPNAQDVMLTSLQVDV